MSGEQLTLFSEDSPARTCPSRERTATGAERGLRESGQGSGSRCCGLFTEQDPLGYWLKTCVELLASPSIPSVLDWKMRDTPSGRSSFLLLRLERPIKESGYSLWE